MSIGERIAQIRQSKGITQAELAKTINVSQAMLCQIERGTKAPSFPLAISIASALGCRLDDITI